MSEWKNMPLEELVEVDPEQLLSSTHDDYSFFYIDISAVSEGFIHFPSHPIKFRDSPSRARKVLKRGDILMATVRPNLKSFAKFNEISDFNFIGSTGFAILRAKKNINIDFIYHSLFSTVVEKQIENLVVGSNYPAINSGDVKKLIIHVPDFLQQNKIANFLNSIDLILEKTQSAIAKYKAIKQGMLQDLFTRGIDMQTGLLRHKYEDAPELYNRSELGFIPKEWGIETLDKVCELITDGSHFSPKPLESGEKIIANVKDMGDFDISYNTCTRISKKDFTTLKNQNCSPLKGDVLLSKDGTVGRVVLFSGKYDIVVLSSIAIIRPNQKSTSDFLYSYLKSEYFDKQLLVKMSGSALRRIVLRDINGLLIAYPQKKEEQTEIAKRLTGIESKLKSEEIYLQKLQKIKTGLMNDLLTGKKEVSIAE